MKYPRNKTAAADSYLHGYVAALQEAYASLDASSIDRAARAVAAAVAESRMIYACGNGGSAAIANHLCCDFGKGMRQGNSLRPRVVSLSATTEMLTAIGNDIGFAEIFAHQLQGLARPGDLLIAISSSGNSENIVRAVSWARANQMEVIGLSGFSGGRLRELAPISIHVRAENYGIVEDVHQSVMHLLAQFLRQSSLDEEAVVAATF